MLAVCLVFAISATAGEGKESRRAFKGIPGKEAEQAGRLRLEAGDCEGARIAFQAALDAFETSERHLLLARALACLDLPEQAYPHAELASAVRGGTDPESTMFLCDLALRLGKEREAQALVNLLSPLPEYFSFALRRRAAIEARKGNFDRAAAIARAAVKGGLTCWDRRALCVIESSRGRAGEAFEHCRTAVRQCGLDPKWLARAVHAMGKGDADTAARILWRPGLELDEYERYRAAAAFDYYAEGGELFEAARALEAFARAGGLPDLEKKTSVSPKTKVSFEYARGSGNSRQGGYDYLAYATALRGNVPLPARFTLFPVVALQHLEEKSFVSGPGPRATRNWGEGRALLEIGAGYDLPVFRLHVMAFAGAYVAGEYALPQLGLNVRRGQTNVWKRLELSVSYGPGHRASRHSYKALALEVRLDTEVEAGLFRLYAGLRERQCASAAQETPREVSARAGLSMPFDLGTLRMAPGLFAAVDRSFGQPLYGVPIDLSGTRESGWIRLDLNARTDEPLSFSASLAWAPLAVGFSRLEGGLERLGDGPWNARVEATLRVRYGVRIHVGAYYSDELRRRNFGVTAGLSFPSM